jgi:hypothetical protein
LRHRITDRNARVQSAIGLPIKIRKRKATAAQSGIYVEGEVSKVEEIDIGGDRRMYGTLFKVTVKLPSGREETFTTTSIPTRGSILG